ncbi:MAG: hypothetical protein IPJ50_16330 [Betaproteobacteria bacterium]|nr:hypothetical protein [Betaproteobacteria bacterium]
MKKIPETLSSMALGVPLAAVYKQYNGVSGTHAQVFSQALAEQCGFSSS